MTGSNIPVLAAVQRKRINKAYLGYRTVKTDFEEDSKKRRLRQICKPRVS
jgi:hypothetical protein